MLPWILGAIAIAVVGLAWYAYAQRRDKIAGPASAASAAAAGASGAAAPGGATGRRFAAANRVQPVSVARVRRMDLRVTSNAIGNIAAANIAVVRAKVDAELVALHFQEGQRVRAGQLLAELDPKPFRIALAQAEGQLARDQAQAANARLDLERFTGLLAKDAIARQQVDTQAALVRQLQGTVQADQAAVENARLQLSYTRITAPISGLAGLKQADLGNVVRAGDANGLLTIAQVQPVNVVFAVPEAQLAAIQSRLAQGEALPVEAWDRDEKRMLAQGRVASTDNAIDPATGTIKLKAAFPNQDGSLFPNQFVNVRLVLDVQKDATAVPAAALQRGAQGSFVYVVGAERSVSMRAVQAGASDGGWVAVQGDVHPGEVVVIDGADRLREGAKVEVIAPGAASGASAAASDAARGAGGWRRRGASDAAAGASAVAMGAAAAAIGASAAPSGPRPPP